ncbi:MAG: hypothetical protein VB934_03995 [Polyangiaceae bacterium]
MDGRTWIVFRASASVLSLLGACFSPFGVARAQPVVPTPRGRGDASPNRRVKPPPLHIDYVTSGIGVSADVLVSEGAVCRQPAGEVVPCILGSGGGLTLRGGYRSPGPWYVGGAYQFSKTNSSNLYRLATLQQLRAEMRYMFDLGYRTTPYATWGAGGVVYGNEWGVETGGGTFLAGVGAEVQLSRLAMIGVALVYQPVVLAGWKDTANYVRAAGVAQYLRLEFLVEIRSELTRR